MIITTGQKIIIVLLLALIALVIIRPMMSQSPQDTMATDTYHSSLAGGTVRMFTTGETARIAVHGGTEAQNTSQIDHVVSQIIAIDDMTNFQRPDSELNRINRTAAESPQVASTHMFNLFTHIINYAKVTDGAFDPTVGPVLLLWQRAGEDQKLPTDQQVAEARSRVGYENIVLDADANSIHYANPQVTVHMGGITNGYAIDQAIEVLMESGLANGAMVRIGRDMRVFGVRQDGKPWRFNILDPEGADTLAVLDLSDVSVSTSGDYAKYVTIEDQKFSNIVDPRTGMPVKHSPSVTVIAPTATQADALATGLSVFDPEQAIAKVNSMDNVEAMIVYDVDGQLRHIQSSGFDAYVSPGTMDTEHEGISETPGAGHAPESDA